MSTRKPRDPQNALLGDLESIRSLLDRVPEASAELDRPDNGPPAQDDALVPLLQDVVEGGLNLDEAPLDQVPLGETDLADPDRPVGLDDETFRALLGDEWRESASRTLADARSKIDQNSTRWTPEHTDRLNDALRVRIDEALKTWLRQLVLANITDLRQTIAASLAESLNEQIGKIIGPAAGNKSDQDAE